MALVRLSGLTSRYLWVVLAAVVAACGGGGGAASSKSEVNADFCPAEFKKSDGTCVACKDTDQDGYPVGGGCDTNESFLDCNDDDDTIYPGSDELDDGIDQDCDGDSAELKRFDLDGDGFTAGTTDSVLKDCNDRVALINPLATEIPYNDLDEDCNGVDLCDADSDGAYSAFVTAGAQLCPANPVTSAVDCDDRNPLMSPLRSEVHYNGADDDCDSTTSDGDADGDQYVSTIMGGGDCNDTSATIRPGVPEIYHNGIDEDCSALTPDYDQDGDGWSATVASGGSPDCDDTSASVSPSAAEIPYNNKDENCDLQISCDGDFDGYYPAHVTQAVWCPVPESAAADCDDDDILVNPGNLSDIPYNDKDDDCDPGTTDGDADGDGFASIAEGGADCNDQSSLVNPGRQEIYYNNIDDDCSSGTRDRDQDGDNWSAGSASGGAPDCNDTNAAVSPSQSEIAYNTIDEDCSGAASCDADYDGFYPSHLTQAAWCPVPTSIVPDCNDGDFQVNPGAPQEIAYNGKDDDCDLSTSDGDGDGDGFLSMAVGGNDCNDANSDVNPGKSEVHYNSQDDDCNSLTHDRDGDGDGWYSTQLSGGSPDCNDQNPTIYPGAPEDDDGIDDDCDGDPVESALNDLDGDGYTRYFGKASDPWPDCNDNNSSINHGADEIYYNNVNEDCDASTVDNDQDADGSPATAETGSNPDCNDLVATINPEAPEEDNGVDDDCDGEAIEAPVFDLDRDGYTPGYGKLGDPTPDCNDSSPIVHGAMKESADDGVDNDCRESDLVAATATTALYVHPTVCNAAGPGTIAQPFCLPSQAVQAASNGRRIFLAAGTYTDSLLISTDVSLYGGYNTSFTVRDIVGTPSNIYNDTTHQIKVSSGKKVVIDGLRLPWRQMNCCRPSTIAFINEGETWMRDVYIGGTAVGADMAQNISNTGKLVFFRAIVDSGAHCGDNCPGISVVSSGDFVMVQSVVRGIALGRGYANGIAQAGPGRLFMAASAVTGGAAMANGTSTGLGGSNAEMTIIGSSIQGAPLTQNSWDGHTIGLSIGAGPQDINVINNTIFGGWDGAALYEGVAMSLATPNSHSIVHNDVFDEGSPHILLLRRNDGAQTDSIDNVNSCGWWGCTETFGNFNELIGVNLKNRGIAPEPYCTGLCAEYKFFLYQDINGNPRPSDAWDVGNREYQ